MDILTLLGEVNYVAVLVATIASFVLGFIRFNPHVFGKQWMGAVGMTEEDTKQSNMAKVMWVSFITTFVIGIVMALLFWGVGGTEGVKMWLILGIGLIATQRIMHMMYEQKCATYLWTSVGYDVLMFAVMGGIIWAR